MAGEARWPLSREQHELLAMLGGLIRRFGRERFLAATLVRADTKDFPDPWEGTLQSVHQVLYRLCWHAYIDPEIVVEDHRPINDEVALLLTSEIEIATCAAGTVTFHVASIGNDDVAGMLAHKIGEVFLELAPGEPFRTAPRVPDEREASVAAVFLGLGVPAANAAMYRRHATKIEGRQERSEQQIAHAGGLDIGDITLLLAIQDVLRDEVQGALATLHPPQRDWVEQWKLALDPHEQQLRELLGLDDTHDGGRARSTEAEAPPLSRPPRPRTAPAYDEKARHRFNVGNETMRVARRSLLGLFPGALLGVFTALGAWRLAGAPQNVVAMVMIGGALAGAVFGFVMWCRPYYRCTAGPCSRLLPRTATTCPHCGATITKTITQKELEAHWRELRAEEDARDELIDPSEFAGDPDADVLRSERARASRSTVRDRHARR